MNRRRKRRRAQQLAAAVGESRREMFKVLSNGLWRDEIIVDNFAGGGGASTGIEFATGRSVEEAINHDPAAIAMHEANHPRTRHHLTSVWDVHPRDIAAGRRVGLAWFSPDCTHHSKARGGKPREKKIRGLAWVAVRWAATVRPRIIILENVEEFVSWGPLDKDGQPIKSQAGRTFRSFVNALKRQGYAVEWRELRASDYGAPTIRKRFFLVARCDGQAIVWPEQTHGDPASEAVRSGRRKPWRTAAEIIDWSIPCPSIFERSKELADNTKRRIARGLMKFVVNDPNPYIIKVNHGGGDFRGQPLNEPMQTMTAKNGYGIVIPSLIQTGYGERKGQAPRSLDINKPLGTVVAGGQKHALVAAFLAQYHTETANHDARGQTLDRPLLTQDTSNRFAVVTSNLVKMRGTNIGQPVTEPLHTVTAGGNHHAEVRAFLVAYYGSSTGQSLNDPLGTVTTHDRFGIVTIHGIDYMIVDIGFRMLEPHELYAAQGFPITYNIANYMVDGKRVTKSAQVARCGNSVPPQFAEAIVRANMPEHCTGSGNVLSFERYRPAADERGQLQLSI